MSKKLRFELTAIANPQILSTLHQRFRSKGRIALNSTEWRGKEPRSCAVTDVRMPPTSLGQPARIDIEVTCRSKGDISYAGHTKYEGWTAMMLDRALDGTLLDGKGQPLKDGDPPVYLPVEVVPDIEFNGIDFGTFIDETDIDGVKRVTAEVILQEIVSSGHANISVRSTFIVPHRSRPQVKVTISNRPSGTAVDGFGTRIINVNEATPHLEHALMTAVTTLVSDYLEGKVSMMNSESRDVTFIELSEVLVDQRPNQIGEDSWFNILHWYTPVGFLHGLAQQVESIYAVNVAVVEGKRCGLVVRRIAS